MNDTELYTQLLGIPSPWKVIEVRLDLTEREVRVRVEWEKTQGRLVCPICQRPAPGYDQREERTWRHLDSCEFETWLVCRPPRIECPEHGVQSVELPWSRPNSRFTLAFESFALQVLQATQTQSQAAHILRISPDRLHELMEGAVERGLSQRTTTEPVPRVTLDETSQGPRHDYLTVLTDGERVLEVTESRTQTAAEITLKNGLSDVQRETVEVVTMDMWRPFEQARAKLLPQAEVVYDRFHLASDLNNAVDVTRRTEGRQSKTRASLLKRTKYLWLKNRELLTDKERTRWKRLRSHGLETMKVWALKEAFRGFFSCRTVQAGEAFFRRWQAAVQRLGNLPLCKVAQRFSDHLPGLLAYLRQRITNAEAEGLNSQIQTLKANARGFKASTNFRIAILFFLGRLHLYPLSSR
jgi:transposase